MYDWVIKECLQQLLKVYVFAEQQYIHAAIESKSPLLKVFYKQRAFERSDFMLRIQKEIDALDNQDSTINTLDAFFRWHHGLYGETSLNHWPITDIAVLNIDEKALEICNCLVNDPIPNNIYNLIEHQRVRLESSLLSFTYLNRLYK